jgi:hypothetical protein
LVFYFEMFLWEKGMLRKAFRKLFFHDKEDGAV